MFKKFNLLIADKLTKHAIHKTLWSKYFCKKCNGEIGPFDLICPHCNKIVFGNNFLNIILSVFLFLLIPIFINIVMILNHINWPIFIYLASIIIFFFIVFFRNIFLLIFISISWLLPLFLIDFMVTYTQQNIANISFNIFQIYIFIFIFYQFIRWLYNFYYRLDEYKYLTTIVIASIIISLFFFIFMLLSDYIINNYPYDPRFWFILKIGSYTDIYFKIRITITIIAILTIIIHSLLKYERIPLIKDKLFNPISYFSIKSLKKNLNNDKKILTLLINLFYGLKIFFQKIINIFINFLNNVYNVVKTIYINFYNLILQIFEEIKHYIKILVNIFYNFIYHFFLPLLFSISLVLIVHFLSLIFYIYNFNDLFYEFLEISLLVLLLFTNIYFLIKYYFIDFAISFKNLFLNYSYQNIWFQKSQKLNPNLINRNDLKIKFEDYNNILRNVEIYTIYIDFLTKFVPIILLLFLFINPFIIKLINWSYIKILNYHFSFFFYTGIVLFIIIIISIFFTTEKEKANR